MTNLAAVWLVATREIRARVKTRSFVIITLLVAALSAGAVVAADIVPGLIEEGPKHMAVVAPAGDPLEQDVTQSATALGVDVKTTSYPDRAAGETALRDGKVDALVTAQGDLLFDSKEDASLSAVANRALYLRSLPAILDNLHLSLTDVRPLVEPQGAAVTFLEPAKDEANKADRIIVGQAATIIIFLTLVLDGQGLLFGVVEEKTSRVVEVLMGTLRPEHLLAGKVIGIVASALFQLVVGFAAGGIALLVVGGAEIPSVALDVALISGVFLALGILSYSFVYAAVGATVSRQSEAESAQAPLSMVLMAPYLLALTTFIDNPDGVVARILSLAPPTAPLTMPARVALGDPLPIEIVASVLLMIPWILAVIWLAGRLYSGAILRSGPRVGLLAAFRGGAETVRGQ